MDDNQNHASTAGLGTPGQTKYIQSLAKQLGYGSPEDAARGVAGEFPLNPQSASKVIEALRQKLTDRGSAGNRTTLDSEPSKRRYLTARTLLQIDAGALPVPSDIDNDAAEVLKRLAQLRDVERVLGTPVQWAGANAGGPIQVDLLVRYFGSIEAVALQFGVGADTVKGWGKHVPPGRAYEAQVRTDGYVCAPR